MLAEETSGAWSVKTQLVWDEAAGELKRRRLDVWDADPAAGLEFHFEPAEGEPLDAAPRLTGRGTLSWRKAGTPSYDNSAVLRTYSGELRDGRAHGQGVLVTEVGDTFEGSWRDGMLDGAAHIRFENGDEYEGDVAKGVLAG